MAIHGKRLATAAGTIRLFEKRGGQWQAQTTIHLPTLDFPGAMAYDGETLAFQGVRSEIDPALGYPVPRYIVVVYRIGPHGEATLMRELRGPLNKLFGRALAVRGDTLVVASNEDGAAYVYRNDHGNWRSEQKLHLRDVGVPLTLLSRETPLESLARHHARSLAAPESGTLHATYR